MRIAMIGQKGMPAIYGGVEQHVHDLAKELATHGHDVTVYGRFWYTNGHAGIVEGARVVLLPSIRTKHLDAITHTFLSTIHALFHRYDILHYHGVGPSLLSWIPRVFLRKTKVVATFHSIDRYHEKWGFFARLMLKLGEYTACAFPHETISISRGIEQYCLNEHGSKTIYIPNGVSLPKAIPTKKALEEFGLIPDQYLLMVSRLVPHKGAHILVEAFTALKKAHVNDDIQKLKLVIVGGSVYTDDYTEALQKQAAVCNDIIFTGFQSGISLDELYANAKALIHPSLNEGLPITVIRAMAHKRPALLSHIPEHVELVKDTRCLYKENDVKDLEERLAQFLALPKEEQDAIGNANYVLIQETYNWRILVRSIITLYEKEKKSSNVIGVTSQESHV